MSPKKPVRPKGTDTPGTDPGTITLPDVRLPPHLALPGTGIPPRPHTSTSEPSGSAGASSQKSPPPPVELTDPTSGAPTAAQPSPRSLDRYALNPPEGLPPARADGLRVNGNGSYVDLDDGKVARVVHDPALNAYYAWGLNELSPSGPALYRPTGAVSWRENAFATKLRAYQLGKDQRAVFDRRNEGLSSQSIKERDAALGPIYRTQQNQLKEDARLFLQNAQRIPRSAAPSLLGVETFSKLIEKIFEHSQGLVMTERFSGTGSKMQLIDAMPALVASGVTTLYLDRLRIDIDQVVLDGFARTGVLDARLKRRLHALDVNDDAVPPTPYTYQNLIIAARENGIRVQALDCAARAQAELSGDDGFRGLLTYHASQVINADRVNRPQGKWVALVGASQYRKRNIALEQEQHATVTFSYPNTPGLAQVQGVMSLHVEDLAHGPNLQIIQDPSLGAADLNLNVGGQGMKPFELPVRYRRVLEQDIRSANLTQDPHSLFATIPVQRGLDVETAQRERFQRARDTISASQYFFEGQPVTRPRPPTPALQPYSPPPAVLESIYRVSNGLVLGAAYNAIGARKFLIDNMPALKEQQVKTLYMENLISEYDQPRLDAFASSGAMSDPLRANLRRQDELQQMNPSSAHSLINLITVAHRHGIKVQALDTSITFRDEMRRHAPERSRNFKYVAHTLIETDQTHRGPLKWVALVESGHANTARNTPGLAELQGAVGVRVVDAGSQPTRVLPDEGEIVSSLLPIARPTAHRTPSGAGYLFVKSDLLLEISTGTQLIRRAPVSPGKLLNKPNEFLIERSEDGFQLYLAKHQLGDFSVYPLLMAADQLSVDIPDLSQHYHRVWQVNRVKFKDIDALVWALKTAGLKQVSGTTVIPVSPLRLMDRHPRLTDPGMYLVETRPEGTMIFHRSKDSSIKRTLVSKDQLSGKLYINRPEWGLTELRLFDNLDALTAHLDEAIGLKRVQSA
ncbi:hypothetical protein M1D68_10555 [Pseudomonas sp. R4-84]